MKAAAKSGCEQFFSTTLALGDEFLGIGEGGVMFRMLAPRPIWCGFGGREIVICSRGNMGFLRVSTHPACTRFKFCGGHHGEVRFSADITAGVAPCDGTLVAFVLEANISAFLHKMASEALGGLLERPCRVLALRMKGEDISLEANYIGRSALSVVAVGDRDSQLGRGPELAASYFEWAFTNKRPNEPNGGLHLQHTEGLPCRFAPPQTFSACGAVTLGDALDGCLSDPEKIIMELHVNWGCAPAPRLHRVLADSGGENVHLVNCVDEVLEHCEVCRASDDASRVRIAGTSAASTFNEKLHVMDAFSKYSPLSSAHPKTPQEFRGASRSAWIGTFWQPKSTLMNRGGRTIQGWARASGFSCKWCLLSLSGGRSLFE